MWVLVGAVLAGLVISFLQEVESIRGLGVAIAEAVMASECAEIGIDDFDECVRGGTQAAINEFLGRDDTDPEHRGE
jgi:hypothetical protein